MTQEVRQIRPIEPVAYLNLCKKVCEAVMVINSEEDVDAFLVFGGKAIIKSDLCQQQLPSLCREFVVSRK